MNRIILFIFLLLISNIGNSQTPEERKKITESYDYSEIEKLRAEIQKKEEQRKERLNQYLKAKGKRAGDRKFEKDGVVYELIDIMPDGTKLYFNTFNEGSAKTIKSNSLNTGGALNLHVNGENMIAGVWDVGIARLTHVEFPNKKITVGDGSTVEDSHSTHVTGTIAAVGVSPSSKGIAPATSVYAFDWKNNATEMLNFEKEEGGLLVSNHSYGLGAFNEDGKALPVGYFGAYDYYSYYYDAFSRQFSKHQIVVSAGNDREKYLEINPNKNGYELIRQMGNSKNVLTVAAVRELLNYTQPSDVKLTTFSNTGPTDDGRIKPNISAKGLGVYSSYYDKDNPADNSYATRNGTSMSTPAITGSILLLQQHFNNLNNQYMESATVRGLLQHTAREAGDDDGPDYKFGWGLANIEAAAIAISDRNNGSFIEENTLSNHSTYTQEITAFGSEPLIVSISWTDLGASNYNNGYNTDPVEDPNEIYLVNDLDIKVTDESNTVYYPWKLDGKNPSKAATRGDNKVDNFERIDIKNPKGKYRIEVSHKGNLAYNAQKYSLIVTGPNLDLGTGETTLSTFETKVYPIPAKNTITISVKEAAGYTIYEMTGKRISSGKLLSGENVVDISDLSQGVYIIKIDNGSKTETKKIIVQ
ncbi:MAG: S8 family peptidase [Flavobacteriaceae bacterium]|nr:S8 family peptidase [Flavobacteriaceae bacterium]